MSILLWLALAILLACAIHRVILNRRSRLFRVGDVVSIGGQRRRITRVKGHTITITTPLTSTALLSAATARLAQQRDRDD